MVFGKTVERQLQGMGLSFLKVAEFLEDKHGGEEGKEEKRVVVIEANWGFDKDKGDNFLGQNPRVLVGWWEKQWRAAISGCSSTTKITKIELCNNFSLFG